MSAGIEWRMQQSEDETQISSKMDEMNISSIPEPDPVCRGYNVPEALINFLNESNAHNANKNIANSVQASINLVKERDNFGRKKYGQPLMSQDGRNTIEDARQEMGDLFQYVFKARMNNENLDEIRRLVPILMLLLET